MPGDNDYYCRTPAWDEVFAHCECCKADEYKQKDPVEFRQPNCRRRSTTTQSRNTHPKKQERQPSGRRLGVVLPRHSFFKMTLRA